jgi:hypothetical protein
MPAQPVEDVGRIAIGREHRVEDLHDDTVLGDQRHPLVEPAAVELEGRQRQPRGEDEPVVADDRKRDLRPRGELLLLGERLRRDAGDASRERRELGSMVAKAARLRRAAARARQLVPARRNRLVGWAGLRVEVEDKPIGSQSGERDVSHRRREHDVRYPHSRQIVGRTIVDGYGQPCGQNVRVVGRLAGSVFHRRHLHWLDYSSTSLGT